MPGYPSEQFYFGAALWETVYGFIAAYPVVCFIFVPVYCNLGITSIYEYLDLRYVSPYLPHPVSIKLILPLCRFNNKLVKRISSISFIIRNCLSMGINQYVPCVALNTIAHVPYWLSLSLMLLFSIVFTFLVCCSPQIHCKKIYKISLIDKQGGLKAAITADTIQGVVLIAVSILITAQGAYETGGVKEVYDINKQNGTQVI